MRRAAVLALFVLGSLRVTAAENSGLLERFLERITGDLGKLPDFVCTQFVERFTRDGPDDVWRKSDTLRFQVGFAGGKEIYAPAGASSFTDKPVADLAGKGSITTGQFQTFARHVFLASASRFTLVGESEQAGRKTFEYRYDIPAAESSYVLRSGSAASKVAFQGSFWIDPQSLDLVRLEVQAYDITEMPGLQEAETSVNYTRISIDGQAAVLPGSATFRIVAVGGAEDLNRTTFEGCRHYRADSLVSFDSNSISGDADRVVPSSPSPHPAVAFAPGTRVELALSAPLKLADAAPGDAIRAVITRTVKNGETGLVGRGAVVTGRVVRLDRREIPFPIWEVALQFDTLEAQDGAGPFVATMENAGPAPGMIREQKRMDPTFSRKRSARMEILVREVQRGQGVLNWDARRGTIPSGFPMTWKTEDAPEK